MQKQKILYRSIYRGSKENEILLGRFVRNNINLLDSDEINLLEGLIEESDNDIFLWLTTDTEPPKVYKNLINRIINKQ